MLPGHYENLITQDLRLQLAGINTQENVVVEQNVDADRAAVFITRYLAEVIGQLLQGLAKNDELNAQLLLANRLLGMLTELGHEVPYKADLELGGSLLRAILPKLAIPFADRDKLPKYLDELEPSLRFSQSELFSGGHSELSLEAELRKEIATADSVDFIVSFVKWSGLRLLLPALKGFAGKGKKIRVLTTTYMGATDYKAVVQLAALHGAEVRVSYNTSHERLHAKAYLFGRNSGLSTAYIGSSNMSRSALTSGLEWNVKVTSQDNRPILEKFAGTFETYWNSAEFELYDGSDEHLQKLKTALQQAGNPTPDVGEALPNFRLKPFPFQQEILDRLAAERAYHNRHRNLVVAATGTGKTVVAAFDYARFAKTSGHLPTLLFVAHREEILRQARATFRHILGEGAFGELWVGGALPVSYNHLFVSIQTFDSKRKDFFEQVLPANHFAYICIDEVHHVAAASYRPLLAYYQPQILLGLTATPERADGETILPDFGDTIAAEVRLPEAVARGLLVPFQYFGVNDPVDYRNVKWINGRYAAEELTQLYTAHKARTSAILDAIDTYLLAHRSAKALCFCVSREHAKKMAEAFKEAGLRAAYLASNDPASADRKEATAKLRKGEINFLFVVDLFNEGVDIPEVDTVLFLRPTESLTIFLQQLGRGLRLHDGKECLTVLDFVGQARSEYSYEQRFRAIIGRTGTTVLDEVESGFVHLPPGCSIQLEREAMEAILANIKAATGGDLRVLIRRIQQYPFETPAPLTLALFLLHTQFTVGDIYRSRAKDSRGWYALKRRANGDQPQPKDYEIQPLQAAWRLAQLSDPSILKFGQELLGSQTPISTLLSLEHGQALGTIWHYLIWQKEGPKTGFTSLQESLKALRDAPNFAAEALEILEVCERQIDLVPDPLALPYKCLLKLHMRYTRDEILAALGRWTFAAMPAQREGVLWLPQLKTELLFVTLQKSAKHYSPSTLYKDYALSENLFHWESQNGTSPESPKGQSYIHHQAQGKTILLFVREQNQDENGLTLPYTCLGPVTYVTHKGARPMSITWRLTHPMPGALWQQASKMAVG